MARQVIALLFTDIVDSTALFGSLGLDRADAVRRDHDQAVAGAVTRAGGTVVKHTGDGIMAAFPGPSAAVEAAVAAQRVVGRTAARHEVVLTIRAGISLGEATEEDGDWFGPPVIEAARLCNAAAAGEILIADRALAMAALDVGVTSIGLLDLKGLDHPVPASRLDWSSETEVEVPMPASLRSPSRLEFVGRTDARARLDQRMARAAKGEGGIVFVAGEPGIGKTRLVTEFASTAHASGVVVTAGRCDESSLFPHQPLVEAVRHLHANGVVPASPGIRLLLPELGDPPVMDPELARRLLMDTVRSALRDAAADRPLLVVLDDLHWADAGSLALLRHLLRDLADVPLLVVGTYRDTDIDRTHPFGALLADLRRADDVERILLAGLDGTEVREVLERAAGHDLGAEATGLAATLVAETSGNPFFLGELLAHLAESGALVQVDGQWTAIMDLASIGLPEGVRDVVGQRLSRLAPATDGVLGVVAVNGRAIELGVLQEVADIEQDAVVLAIDEAVGAGLLVERVEGSHPTYEFSHALVRHTLLEELTTARRLRIHARLAEAYAGRAERNPERWLDAVHHGLEAAPLLGVARVGDVLVAALDHLERRSSAEVLLTTVKRFDDLAREMNAEPTDAWVRILCRGGQAAFTMGDRPRIRAKAVRAIELSRSVPDSAAFCQAVAMLAHSTGFGLDPEFLALLPEALDRAAPGSPEQLSLLCQELYVATYLGSADVSVKGPAIIELAVQAGDEQSLIMAASQVAYAGQAAIPAATTLHYSDLVDDLGPAMRPMSRCTHLLARSYALIRLDRLADARACAIELRNVAVRHSLEVLIAAGHQVLAMIDLAEGRLDRAAEEVEAVRHHAPSEPMMAAGCVVQEMWLAHLRGDDEAARAHLDELVGLPYPVLVMATRGWLATRTGRREVALDAAAELAALDVASLPTNWTSPGLWMMAGMLATEVGHAGLSAQVEPLLAPLAGEQIIYVCNFVVGPADDTLRDLAALSGR